MSTSQGTNGDLLQRQVELSPLKKALLNKLKRGEINTAAGITRRAENVPIPLSFAQQRLWFLDQITPGNPFYNTPLLMRLRGRLHLQALRRSLEEIARRHESLRTTFIGTETQPFQVVQPFSQAGFICPVIDLRSLPNEQREEVAQRLAQRDAAQPFDLTRDYLLRALVMYLDDDDAVLQVTLHHITIDAWSIGIFYRELSTLYNAFSNDQPSPLAEMVLQYSDFALWQREQWQDERMQQHLAYWRTQLKDLPTLQLPTDFPRPPVETFQGARVSFEIAPQIYTRLAALSKEEGVTLFTTLFSVFQMLLARYSGQEEIVVGIPIANRSHLELEGVIGCFVNTLVVRTDLRGEPTVRELFAEVRRVLLESYEHQEVPFERLVEELQPQRDMSRQPLFQVAFRLENATRHDLALTDVTLSPFETAHTTAKNDLTLVLIETSQRLFGHVEYSTSLFATETIERMVYHLQMLLTALPSALDRPLWQLPLLTPAEEELLLKTWNATTLSLPTELFPQQLMRQAARTPDASAMVQDGAQLSYGEVLARSSQLAQLLRQQGVGPDVAVAVYMPRSPELVLAQLAILLAGGCYLPLDPSLPAQRLAWMLHDAQVSLLLTQQELCPSLAGVASDLTVWCLDKQWENLAAQLLGASLADLPPVELLEQHLAYIIYTSGSTGQPKGVQITHAGLRNLVSWHREAFALTSQDRCTHLAGLGFDAAVWEVWPALACGASVLLVQEQDRLAPPLLAATLQREQISVSFVPTALADPVLCSDWSATPGALRLLMVGGDRLHRGAPASFAARLVNNYGPTECTVVATSGVIAPPGEHEDVEAVVLPTLGKPIANTRLYVLDSRGQLVPVGVAGELYIGGEGVARGYLGRPALTAERFVPHPWSQEPGARLYRTGDRVRWRRDGTLEFLGRLDTQVKLRGYRIELGEIEAALLSLPQVREALVLLKTDDQGGQDAQLVAYLVGEPLAEGQPPVAQRELRLQLKEQLPDYMVPSVLLWLEALPLTANGKIDLHALPEPQQAMSVSEEERPVTATENVLLQIWRQVLGREQIKIHDDFFALGGHSLLAMQIVSRVREALQVELPLRSIFETPTIAEMAERTLQLQKFKGKLTRDAIPTVERTGYLPLSFAQQRLWFLDKLVPDSPFYNISFALRLKGPLAVQILQRSLAEIVRRHEVVRTKFKALNNQAYQLIVPFTQNLLSLPLIDLQSFTTDTREDQARQIIQQELQHSFNLAQDIPLRAQLIRLRSAEHIFLLTMHHIVSDAWSLEVLQHELQQLYTAFSENRPSPLAELALQYGDFAVWQREEGQAERMQQHLAYWRTQLRDLPTLQLPTDFPRPPVESFRGSTYRFVCSQEQTEDLKMLSKQEGVTLFTTLLAAFQMLLARYSGQEEIVVGIPIANRTHLQLEGLIGCFVNTLVVRSDFARSATMQEGLAEVRRVLLEAFEHQEVPFERLVEEIQPQRDTSRQPLCQVLFQLHNESPQTLSLPDLELRGLVAENKTAKCDLTLSMLETSTGLHGYIEYNTDLFTSDTIALLAQHLQLLLTALPSALDRPLWQLPLLTPSEEELLLKTWNATTLSLPTELFPQQLMRQAARTPDASALVQDGAQLSYGEVLARSSQLAQLLRQQGVGPDVAVAVCLPRSFEQLLAALAILLAGGCYVPLDPSLPAQRLAWMLHDAQVSLLLTQQELCPSLAGVASDLTVWCLDKQWENLAAQLLQGSLADLPPAGLSEQHLAYIIYTSGSTGQPKGVQITHAGLRNLVGWHREAFALTSQDRCTHLAGLGFDAAVWEVWPALACGASVLLVREQDRLAPPLLAATLQREQISVSFVPTALADPVICSDWSATPGALRLLLVGGDRLHRGAPASFAARLVNNYGPTECTVVASSGVIAPSGEHEDVEAAVLPSLGKPIANTRLYVLDSRGQLVPVGVAGELYIGGEGVARGYLGRPALTAERFVPHPWSQEPGERLYRTGDRVRWRRDGTLEFLGRLDTQVKLRGYRIELGEIEAVLLSLPQVREALVLLKTDDQGGQDAQLVAYLVGEPLAEGQPPVAQRELRLQLKEQLPDYMVPSVLLWLEALPLTANGKIDLRALPEPIGEVKEATYVLPTSELERQVASVWQELLQRKEIDVNDNFFDIGGHSLQLLMMQSKLQELLKKELSILVLFQHPTISAIAQYLGQAQKSGVAEPDGEVLKRGKTRRAAAMQNARPRRHTNS